MAIIKELGAEQAVETLGAVLEALDLPVGVKSSESEGWLFRNKAARDLPQDAQDQLFLVQKSDVDGAIEISRPTPTASRNLLPKNVGSAACQSGQTDRKLEDFTILQGALDIIETSVVVYDQADCLRYWNRRFADFFSKYRDKLTQGMTRREVLELMAAEPHFEIGKDEKKNWVEERLRQIDDALRQGEQIKVTGEKTAYVLSATRLENGYLIITRTDVSKLHSLSGQLERSSREAERVSQDLERVINSLDLGVVLLDGDLRADIVNDTFHTIWKTNPRDFVDRPHFRDLIEINRSNGIYDVSDAQWDDYVDERLSAIRTGNIRAKNLKRADGVHLLYSVTNLSGGRRLITYFDITEQVERRKALEAANKANEAITKDLERVINSLDLGVVLLDRDLKADIVNDTFHRIWNTKPEDFANRPDFRDLMDINRSNGIYDVEDDAWEAYVQERLAAIRIGNIHSLHMKRADGVHLLYSVTNLSGGRRLISYFDITDQKKYQAELEAARAEALAADRAKSEFLANMSHEIRTPMNGVMGMAELLAKTGLDGKQKMFADVIVKSGAALLTIINDILDFSKLDAGQMELDPAPFGIVEAVEDVATLVSSRVDEKDIELIVRVDPKLPSKLVGDVGRIRQIITNLMGNAVKFTENGHVYVNVMGSLAEKAGKQIAKLRFEVEDTGIGIPTTKCEKIFEKFSQADTSASRRHEGTGLGLSIAKSLVELMGGRIGVTSQEGAGSTFWFEIDLPVSHEDAETTRVPLDVSGSAILVVDDNPVNRSILSEQLRSWNFEVACVSSGQEALNVMRRAVAAGVKIDCIILDYHMPEMNGEEVVAEMKAEAELSRLPVIMLTSVDRTEDGKRFSSLGIDEHLVKPARSSQLLETIVGVLETQHSVRRGAAAAAMLAGSGTQATSDIDASPTSVHERSGSVELANPDQAHYQTSPQLRDAPDATSCSSADTDSQEKSLESRQRRGQEQLNVLICEDNEVNRILFTQIMERAGFSYKIAPNGKVGVEMVKAYRPDIILMDVSMPEMNGFEATAMIREWEASSGRQTPIIGVTAHALKGDKEKCLEAGMDDYISKPVSPDHLTEKVQTWMGKLAFEGIA